MIQVYRIMVQVFFYCKILQCSVIACDQKMCVSSTWLTEKVHAQDKPIL